jgi:hypothetical protein
VKLKDVAEMESPFNLPQKIRMDDAGLLNAGITD